MRILHLTLKKKWFDLIASGEKKEEYRQWKPYWAIRLIQGGMAGACEVWAGNDGLFKKYDVIRFKNGYTKDAPEMDVRCEGIELRRGKSEWGALIGKSIVIKLGKIISINNYSHP